MTQSPVVTVFGGTGFLGRRIVSSLLQDGMRVRIAARHPGKTGFASRTGEQLELHEADLLDESSVSRALAGATGAINAVSLYVEHGDVTFEAIHVRGAATAARLAHLAGVQRYIHVSGIGVVKDSPSRFVRARADGEEAVRKEYTNAIILRPSVMFGQGDSFLSNLVSVSRSPIIPLFGRGTTRLQPAFVEDVALAALKLIKMPESGAATYELGGADIYTYRQIIELLLRHLGRHRMLVPIPFPAWTAMTTVLSVLPQPPLTRDQLILMQADNVARPDAAGFAELGIRAHSLAEMLDTVLKSG